MICYNCGNEFITESCPFCGVPRKNEELEQAAIDALNASEDGTAYEEYGSTEHSGKNRKVALILCIFLGWSGAHQFYVGRIGIGICYLFTLGCLGFGWVTDIIKILIGVFPDKDGIPLRDPVKYD